MDVSGYPAGHEVYAEGRIEMSELLVSIEKTVTYLRERYPADLPLLVDLEKKLDYLQTKKKNSPQKMSFTAERAD